MSSSSAANSQRRELFEQALKDAFDLLENAFVTGRRVVPLFGAGISVDAGIPLISTLRDYLTRVENYITIEKERSSCADYLKERGWPERHELNARILSSEKREELLRRTGTERAWLKQLDDITDGDPALRDLFFVQLTRGRRPASCHHSIAFLAKLMNWPLILTTNFDNLIENALYEQGMQPTVYELTIHEKFPDRRLVVGNPAVVKLHGGVANLITGQMLNQKLPPESRERVLKYFPEGALLLLVLGYSGNDERVMSIVQKYCDGGDGDNDPRALWIHRSDSPGEKVHEIIDGGQLIAAKYADGDRFLQELYARLTTTHPVSRVPYRVLAQVPPQTQWTVQREDSERERLLRDKFRVVLYTRDTAPYGTSTALASDLETWFPTHKLIWCDMEEIPTVDSLIAYIQNEIRRSDPEVPPFALFRGSEWAGTAAEGQPTVQPTDNFENDPRVTRLVEALQRDSYLLVVDSLGEFGNSHVADFVNRAGEPVLSEQRTDQLLAEHRRLRAFLLALADDKSESFGESKMYIAHTYLKTGNPAKDAEMKRESKDFIGDLTGCPDAVEVPNRLPDDPPFLRPELEALLTEKAKRELKAIPKESLDKQVSVVWEGLKDNRYRVLLAVSCAFRRPRSLVALRRLAAPLLLGLSKAQKSACFTAEFFKQLAKTHGNIWNHNLRRDDRHTVDSLLEKLSSLGLLVRQEGGFFWMHRVVRNTISQCVLKEIKLLKNERAREEALLGVGDLHDVIGSYYYSQVFRQSNDPAAFFEYVFHRLASIRCGDGGRRNHRLEDLCRALTRHRDHLLSEGQAGMLIGWITNIQQWELGEWDVQHAGEGSKHEQQELRRLEREIKATLCDLEADVLRQAGDLTGCIAVRVRQIRDRLGEGSIVPKALQKKDWKAITNVSRRADSRTIANAIQRDEFIGTLKRIVETKVAFECQDSAPEAGRRGFRLLDHIFDIAVCMKSLRVNPKKVATLMTTIQEVTKEIEPSIATPVKPSARHARVRCSFRLIDLWTGQIDPRRPQVADEQWLINSGEQLHLGHQILQEYPGLSDRDEARYTCSLNTVGARANYLRGRFSLAYQLLDTAQAAVWPRDRGSDRTSIAVCLMHRAECLMVHAHYQLRMKSAHEAARTRSGIEPDIWGTARGKLEGARTELMQAHELLLQGRPNNWWWTWLYLLFAQWHHESFALCLDAPYTTMWPGSGQASQSLLPFNHASKRYLADILNTVRDGLDNVRLDLQRRNELCILWWQAFICQIFAGQRIAAGFWQNNQRFQDLWPEKEKVTGLWNEWETRNKALHLHDFFQEQNRNYGEQIVAAWDAERWNDLENQCAKRPNPYKHNGRSLRNILLTIEWKLLNLVLPSEGQKGETEQTKEPSPTTGPSQRQRRKKGAKGRL